MDPPTIRIARRFVEWWQNGTHGHSTDFDGAEYTLARDAFITGFISPLVNAFGDQLQSETAQSLRKQVEDAINDCIAKPSSENN